MKTTIKMEDGLTVIVFEPENDFETMAIEAAANKNSSTEMEVKANYNREFHTKHQIYITIKPKQL